MTPGHYDCSGERTEAEMWLRLLTLLTVGLASIEAAHLLDGIYCGRRDCYEVLNVTRESTKPEVARNYRQLARKFHPDSHRTEEAKKEAEEQFKIIATAYEILKDDEARTDYNYMLDNPQEYYAHYYRYYRRVAPKVDVRLVIAVTVSIISAIQYYSARQRYESAIDYFASVPKYRHRALNLVKSESEEIQSKKKDKKEKISKSEQKEKLEKMIRKVIKEKMDIKGSYAEPKITDILWIQLIILPYTIVMYIYWYVKWIWNFNILKQPYGDEEKLYLIRKNLNMGVHQFNAIDEETKQEYLEDELWIKENFIEWKEEAEEEAKKKLADNAKYKQYRRYMKNNASRRITFDD